MIQYEATGLKVKDTTITLNVTGKGAVSANLAEWADLIKNIGGEGNISKVKLLGSDLLEFPNDVHVEIEDIVHLAEKQMENAATASSNSFLKKLQSYEKEKKD